MKPINLLPEDYVISRRRRSRRRTALTWAIASCCFLCTWAGIVLLQKRSINQQLHEARATLASLNESAVRIEAQQQLVKQRQAELAQLSQVRDVLPWPAVLALLSREFPQEGALSSLMIFVPELTPAPSRPGSQGAYRPVRAASGQTGTITRGASSSTTADDLGHDVRVELEGVAASDVIVAAYARKLSETGVFEQVRIEDAKAVTIHDQPMHQFKLSAKIAMTTSPRQPGHTGPTSHARRP